jgi:hypothetical protein
MCDFAIYRHFESSSIENLKLMRKRALQKGYTKYAETNMHRIEVKKCCLLCKHCDEKVEEWICTRHGKSMVIQVTENFCDDFEIKEYLSPHKNQAQDMCSGEERDE